MRNLALLNAVLLLLFLTIVGCRPDREVERLKAAKRYLANRPEISAEFRSAIERGQILPGMAPDEAAAAGGANIFIIERDKLAWPNEGTDPWVVLATQRLKPDNSKITLRFFNKTQFGSEEAVPFAVHFVRGRAVRVEREKTQ